MNVSLHKWWPFWVASSSPLIIGIACALFISYEQELNSNFSYEGFLTAYKYLKLPLWIAALTFPLAALMTSIHRSAQTHKQISLVTEQNTFSNFLKHREEFFKLLNDLEKEKSIKFGARANLYKEIFPKNDFNSIDIKAHSLDGPSKIETFYLDIKAIASQVGSIEELKSHNEKTMRRFYAKLFKCGAFLSLSFENSHKSRPIYWIDSDKWHISYSDSDVISHIGLLESIMSAISYYACYEKDTSISLMDPSFAFITAARKTHSESTRDHYIQTKAFYPDSVIDED